MTEWILLLTINLIGQSGEIRDISPQIIGGFSSKQTCETAAESISHRFIVLAGKAREQQGIQSNTFKSAPSIWQECINIQK